MSDPEEGWGEGEMGRKTGATKFPGAEKGGKVNRKVIINYL
jgi:hypothetical protein